MIQMNLFTEQKQTHRLREGLMVNKSKVGAIFKTGNQEPTLELRELSSILCHNLNGKRI